MQNAPEPVLAVWLTTVLHDQLGEVGDFLWIHPQATVGCGFAEASDGVGPVNVVVGLAEEDLHDFHGIPWLPGALGGLTLGPRRTRRRLPAGVPDNFFDGVATGRCRVSLLPDRYLIRLNGRLPALHKEHAGAQIRLEGQGPLLTALGGCPGI